MPIVETIRAGCGDSYDDDAVAGTASLSRCPGRHRDRREPGRLPFDDIGRGGADRLLTMLLAHGGKVSPALLRRFRDLSHTSGYDGSHGSIEVIGPSDRERRSFRRNRETSGRQMVHLTVPADSSSKDAGSGT